MVDMYTVHGTGNCFAEWTSPHPDFLKDLTVSLLNKRTISDEVKTEYSELKVGLPTSYYPKDVNMSNGTVPADVHIEDASEGAGTAS